jgi:uncharacterized protein (DUF2267 family)
MTTVSAFERSIYTADRWVSDLASELGESEEHAYAVMRTVLHALRDRLPHDESAHFAAQLPMLVRGAYYDGWRPSHTPEKYHDAEEFIGRIVREGHMNSGTEASAAAEATMTMLRRHVSDGEISDVLAVLPLPVRALLDGASVASDRV